MKIIKFYLLFLFFFSQVFANELSTDVEYLVEMNLNDAAYQAYVKEFPYDDYTIYHVPSLGLF